VEARSGKAIRVVDIRHAALDLLTRLEKRNNVKKNFNSYSEKNIGRKNQNIFLSSGIINLCFLLIVSLKIIYQCMKNMRNMKVILF
jgi:hypothetical protein